MDERHQSGSSCSLLPSFPELADEERGSFVSGSDGRRSSTASDAPRFPSEGECRPRLRRAVPRIDSLDVESVLLAGLPHLPAKEQTFAYAMYMVFQTIGLVYSDMGTSPLYAYSSAFNEFEIEGASDILGAVSIVIYTITLIPLIKYVLVVLRANDREDDLKGGSFSLYSLICQYAKVSLIPNRQQADDELSNFKIQLPSQRLERALRMKERLEKYTSLKTALLVMALLGVSLVISNGILTPCISVTSAVNGLRVGIPSLSEDLVVGVAVALLVVLFSIQGFGTGKIALVFAPVMCLWLAALAAIGISNIIKYDSAIFKAFNPMFIYSFFRRNGGKAWRALGGLALCITATCMAATWWTGKRVGGGGGGWAEGLGAVVGVSGGSNRLGVTGRRIVGSSGCQRGQQQGKQTHEVGEASRPPQSDDDIFRTQLVAAVTMFSQVMQNPRFLAFLQPPLPSQLVESQEQRPEPIKVQAQALLIYVDSLCVFMRRKRVEPTLEAASEIKACLYEDFEEARRAWNGQAPALEVGIPVQDLLDPVAQYAINAVILFFAGKMPIAQDVGQWVDFLLKRKVVHGVYFGARGFYELLLADMEVRNVLLEMSPFFFKMQMTHVLPWALTKDYQSLIRHKCLVWVEIVDFFRMWTFSAVVGNAAWADIVEEHNQHEFAGQCSYFAGYWIAYAGLQDFSGLLRLVRHELQPILLYNDPHGRWMGVQCLLNGRVHEFGGGEVMFADFGDLPTRSIQISFPLLVYPCLLLSYMGQAAYLLDNPQEANNVFFKSIPGALFWPMFFLAISAAMIASRSVILATFSVIKMALALDCFPRVKIIHTSKRLMGQIYIPMVNAFLMIMCVVVTACLRSTYRIGHAYCVAVLGDMLVTTGFVTLIMIMIWQSSLLVALGFMLVIGAVELVYLAAVLLEVHQGGWIPMASSIILLIIMYIWHYGTRMKYQSEVEQRISIDYMLELGANLGTVRVPGVGLLYNELVRGVPAIFGYFMKSLPAMHSTIVFVCIKYVPVPMVPQSERFLFRRVCPRDYHLFRCVARYGYKDVRKEDHYIFEQLLLQSLENFIQKEAQEYALECDSNGMESDDSERDFAPPAEIFSSRPPSLGPLTLPLLSNDVLPGLDSMIDRSVESSFSDLPSGAPSSINLDDNAVMELAAVRDAKESGVVYLNSHADVRAKKQSWFAKKLVINYFYSFLSRNCRATGEALSVPHTHLMEVGMTYMV
ncbi:hypothetical protein L7F22_035592 [Adiantum nelumboides]|nr:hypothetical protein [Adiantum nelumboides]